RMAMGTRWWMAEARRSFTGSRRSRENQRTTRGDLLRASRFSAVLERLLWCASSLLLAGIRTRGGLFPVGKSISWKLAEAWMCGAPNLRLKLPICGPTQTRRRLTNGIATTAQDFFRCRARTVRRSHWHRRSRTTEHAFVVKYQSRAAASLLAQ